MDPSPRAVGYDIFKLIVAFILLILFLFFWGRPADEAFGPGPATIPVRGAVAAIASEEVTAGRTSLPASTSSLPRTSTPMTLLSPTATVEPAPTASLPSPTVTNLASETKTPVPSQGAVPGEAPTPTPGTEVQAAATACDGAVSRSRLQAGMNATILRRLNFRSSPGIRDNWLLTNIPGTQVEVIGGAECVPYSAGAYLWWQIKLPDGRIGWSAEGSLHGSFYFMEPQQIPSG